MCFGGGRRNANAFGVYTYDGGVVVGSSVWLNCSIVVLSAQRGMIDIVPKRIIRKHSPPREDTTCTRNPSSIFASWSDLSQLIFSATSEIATAYDYKQCTYSIYSACLFNQSCKSNTLPDTTFPSPPRWNSRIACKSVAIMRETSWRRPQPGNPTTIA